MAEHVKLVYKRKYPLDLVISEQCIEKYNSIFFFLLRLKRINELLHHLWKHLSTAEFRVTLSSSLNNYIIEAANKVV